MHQRTRDADASRVLHSAAASAVVAEVAAASPVAAAVVTASAVAAAAGAAAVVAAGAECWCWYRCCCCCCAVAGNVTVACRYGPCKSRLPVIKISKRINEKNKNKTHHMRLESSILIPVSNSTAAPVV